MEKSWIKIFSSNDNIEVEIIKHVLHSNNIKSVIMNNKDSSYLMFGTVDLYVNKEDYDSAMKIINEEDERKK